MVKRINEAFSDEEHEKLVQKKEELKKQLELDSISWSKFFLHITNIKRIR